MLIESRPALDPELGALVTAHQRETQGTAAFAPPGDAFGDAEYLVAAVGGRAVACAAWRAAAEDGVAELTRMYVRPAFRRRGIARQLIVAVEEEVLAVDRLVVRLEAGDFRPAAIELLRSCGYRPVPGGRCFAKRLAALIQ